MAMLITKAAEESNAENLLVLDDPALQLLRADTADIKSHL
jgi:hypothetical protein